MTGHTLTERLINWVVRHRLLVGLGWLGITVVGLLVAPQVSDRLQSGLTVDSPAYHANQQIGRQYGLAAANPGVLVLNLPAGKTVDTPGVRQQLATVDSALQTAPGYRDLSFASTGNRGLVGTGGHSTIVLVYPDSELHTDSAAAVLTKLGATAQQAIPGTTAHVTGISALSSGGSAQGSGVFTEILIGAGAALLVLAWVFGSVLAFVPLLTGIVSLLTMQLAVYGLTYVTNIAINPATQFIVALLGLGMSIDYGLLVVNRWREERARGLDNAEAVRESLRRAGHAVAFSGITASLGLFALIVVPVSLVQGIGLAGLFIPATATLVSLTLLPALLAWAGPRLEWPRKRKIQAGASRFWAGWARWVVRRRVVATIVGLAVLVPLTVVALGVNVAQPQATSLSSSGPAYEGLVALQHDGFPTGVLTSVPVWLPAGVDQQSTATSLANGSGVQAAVASADPSWHVGGSSIVMVLPVHEAGTTSAGSLVADLRAAVPPGAMIGGEQVQSADVTAAMYGAFPLLLAVVALVTFLLMARGLRSFLLPLKAVLLNILSVGASIGVLVLMWQWGWVVPAIWQLPTTGAISSWVPMLLFGLLFGVSMDYEVFVLSRMRENYDRTHSTNAAVVEGIGHTGRMVTSAALILFCALVSLSSAPDLTVKMISTGMAAGVLLDATVVRMLLVPALVSLFGRANWWLPNWAARLLRVPSRPPVSGQDTADDRPAPVHA
jgi:uncharacterized membrane protein YdfJ with MMPL/SSD domain